MIIVENMFAGITPAILAVEVVSAVSIPVVATALGGRGHTVARRFDCALSAIARRPLVAILFVVALCVCLRVATLQWLPKPIPSIHDEFSYLLAADTFASGRLTNPTHPMWVHFESFHIIHQPTYQSMYPVAQGLVLAFGKVILGHAWYGVLLSVAAMCGAITWMLYGWVPPRWALFGGVIAVLRLGILTYWMNSYWGGAAAATGGALLVGAIPRLIKRLDPVHAGIAALGIAILANSRPYEGLVLTISSAVVLLVCYMRQRKPIAAKALWRSLLPASGVLALVACGMMYYFWRVTGNPLHMPYQVNRETYAVVPVLYGQGVRPAPEYRHALLREFYLVSEVGWYSFSAGIRHVPQAIAAKALFVFQFFLWPAMLLPLSMIHRTLRDRRVRAASWILATTAIGFALELYNQPHYYAPVSCLLVLMIIQGLRHWRAADPGVGGRAIPWLLLAVCLITAGMRLNSLVHLECANRAEGLMGRRAQVEQFLTAQRGKHLVIVQYSPDHLPFLEWVYNEANIDDAKIVWARDMGAKDNAELLRYFHDRQTWLVEADQAPLRMQLVGTPAFGEKAKQ